MKLRPWLVPVSVPSPPGSAPRHCYQESRMIVSIRDEVVVGSTASDHRALHRQQIPDVGTRALT